MNLKGFSHLPAVKKVFTNTNVFSIKTRTSQKERKCCNCKKIISVGQEYQEVLGSHFREKRNWKFCMDCAIPKDVVDEVYRRVW